MPPPFRFLITGGLLFSCRCANFLKGPLWFMSIPECSCIICKIMNLNSPSVILVRVFSYTSFSCRQQKHFYPLGQLKSFCFEFCQSYKMTTFFWKAVAAVFVLSCLCHTWCTLSSWNVLVHLQGSLKCFLKTCQHDNLVLIGVNILNSHNLW